MAEIDEIAFDFGLLGTFFLHIFDLNKISFIFSVV